MSDSESLRDRHTDIGAGQAADDADALLAQLAAGTGDRSAVLRAYRVLASLICGQALLPPDAGHVASRLAALISDPASPAHAPAAILAGIITERIYAHPTVALEPARRSILEVMDGLVAALPEMCSTPPAAFAMLYLLAHFPADGASILAAFDGVNIAVADRERLRRCLHCPDFNKAEELLNSVGRVWPSPTVWQLTNDEARLDQAWRGSLRLRADTVRTMWEAETTALLAYLGAQADHALERSLHA